MNPPKPLARRLFKLLKFLTFGYLALCLLLFVFQRKLLYFPVQDRGASPEIATTFKMEDHTLHGWLLNASAEDAVIYYGGNAEAIEGNLITFQLLWPKHAIYLLAYRGYGASEGSPTEQGLYEDALAVFDQVKAKHKKVNLVGRSLGSGVATYVAANRDAHKLVLITPFDSIVAVAQQQYSIFPVKLLMVDRYDSLQRVADIQEPTLLLVAAKDQIVPRANSDRLAAQFKAEQRKVVLVEGANHNNISRFEAFHAALKAFL